MIKTLNSLYGIKAADDHFVVRKLQEIRPSSYLGVGEERTSRVCKIQVGYAAHFDGWRTSRVESVMEAENAS